MDKKTKNLTPRPLVSFPDLHRVTLGDGGVAAWMKHIADVTAKDILLKFNQEGSMANYDRVANGLTGGHVGNPWQHGLLCECIRGISDILVWRYDAELDAELDTIIARIRRAQAADEANLLNPYTTLERPHQRWGRNGGNIIFQHETYNAGCMIEAGVHHYLATGKTSMLEVAVKTGNVLADFVGEAPKHNVVAEHSLPEEAFLKMYRLFESDAVLSERLDARPQEYLRLARYFILHKGDNETRYTEPKFQREYAQDHRPAKEQREAIGHAVRAMLFYAAMASLAMEDADQELADACLALWDDVTNTKLHINGSVGAHPYEERFGHQYELPNNAYLETCAGVGFLFFGSEMFKLTAQGAIFNELEGTLRNVLPAAVSQDGVKYTYVNPLESDGRLERWSWHVCPCCPPMLLKAVGLLPSLIFAERQNDVYLNFYIDSTLQRDDCRLTLKGDSLSIQTDKKDVDLTLHLRIPGWARGFKVLLDGRELSYDEQNGYAVIHRCFADNDTLELCYGTPLVKYQAHPFVSADHGRVAIKHGPVLYCAEGVDNPELTAVDRFDFELDDQTPLTLHDDGSIRTRTSTGEPVRLVPYHSWNNRDKGPMRVWFKQKNHMPDVINTEPWEGLLYRPLYEYGQ